MGASSHSLRGGCSWGSLVQDFSFPNGAALLEISFSGIFIPPADLCWGLFYLSSEDHWLRSLMQNFSFPPAELPSEIPYSEILISPVKLPYQEIYYSGMLISPIESFHRKCYSQMLSFPSRSQSWMLISVASPKEYTIVVPSPRIGGAEDFLTSSNNISCWVSPTKASYSRPEFFL